MSVASNFSRSFAARTVTALALALLLVGCKVTINFPQLGITSPAAGTLTDGYQTIAYNRAFTGSGGTLPYNWTVTVGTLPTGLTLDPNTGALTGTPTANGNFSFTVQLMDADAATDTRAYTINTFTLPTITAPAAGALPNAVQNSAYGPVNFTFANGKAPLTWSVLNGTLPTGLSLNTSSGVLNGTPTVLGNSSFDVRITDANGRTDTRSYTLAVVDLPVITGPAAGALTEGYNTVNYAGVTFTAAGGQTPYTFSVSAGAIPTGLNLVGATGVLSGTPTAAGNFSFTIMVTDNNLDTDTRNYTIDIFNLPTITAPGAGALSDAPLNAAYGPVNFTASGGKAPLTWSVSAGALPTGLSLASGTGVLSGTPTVVQSTSFSVTVTDANSQTDTLAYTLDVVDLPVITAPAAGQQSDVYNGDVFSTMTISVSGGATPYTFAVTTGALPTGLTLDTNAGTIDGTLSAAGNFSFEITVTDNNTNTSMRTFMIDVYDPPTITSPAAGAISPDANINAPYSRTWTAANGKTPYTWSVSAGTLPTGLTLDTNTGTVSGTPTVVESQNFDITVTDANSKTATLNYDLAVVTESAPIANNDTYDAIGNTLLTVNAANGVLNNDTGGGLSVTAFDANSVNGGTVNVNADGSFTYIAVAGDRTASDSFTYTINNTVGPAAVGTVTINVTNMVWYIDSSSAGANIGTSADPFTSLATYTANATDAAGDFIHVAPGAGNYTGGITLLDSQQLIGAGVDLVVNAITLITATTRPVITNGGGVGVTLGADNTVRGLTVGDTTGSGIFGNAVGALTVNSVDFTGNGRSFNITGGTVAITVDSIASTGGATGLSCTNIDGNLTVTGAMTITNPGAEAINCNGGAAVYNFGDITISGGTSGLLLASLTGSFTVGGTTSITQAAATGSGISCNTGSANYTFGTVTMSRAAANAAIGVNLVDLTGTFMLTSTGGGLAWTAGGTSDGVVIDNCSNVTIAGTDAGNRFVIDGAGAGGNSPDQAVRIQNSGNVTLSFVTITNVGSGGNAEHGVSVATPDDGSVVTISDCLISNMQGGASDGVHFTSNAAVAATLTITNTTIQDINDDGLEMIIGGTSVTTVNITGCTFNGHTGGLTPDFGIDIISTGGGSPTANITIGGPSMAEGNTFQNWDAAANVDGVRIQSDGTATFNTLFQNNTLRNIQGDGLGMGPADNAVMNTTVRDNTFESTVPNGFLLGFRGAATAGAIHRVVVYDNESPNFVMMRDNGGGNGLLEMGADDPSAAFGNMPQNGRTANADIATLLTENGNTTTAGAPNSNPLGTNNFNIVDETTIPVP
ncbi:MAG: beta strand repeat-containing protein [Planctomycetota bacterium]